MKGARISCSKACANAALGSPPVSMQCEVCREVFVRHATKIRGDSATCSFACRGRLKTINGWEYRQCSRCSEPFPCKKAKTTKYCSRKCSDVAQVVRESRNCTTCGSVFERQPSDFRGGAIGDFCSNDCRLAGWVAWRTKYATDEDREAGVREYQRSWGAANRDKRRAAVARYRARNPDLVRERDREARARARSKGSVRIETVHRDVLWERDGGRCHLCGKPCDPNDWHADHIIPRSQGGVTSYANMAVSHPFCNMSKGARAVGDQLRIL